VLLDQADAGRVLCIAFLGVPFPRDYTITHTNPGWTAKFMEPLKRKIVVRIYGGLGNQLFQYACGRALSIEKRSELILDSSDLKHEKLRAFELGNFCIPGSVKQYAYSEEKKQIPKYHPVGAMQRIEYKFFWKTFSETGLSRYNPDLIRSDKNLYLWGYWQSPRYFSKHASVIKNDLAFRLDNNAEYSDLVNTMLSTQSVAVHVRRGDYASNSNLTTRYGLLGASYYSRAVKEIERRLHDPMFFVFSDDVSAAREIMGSSSRIAYVTTTPRKSGFDDFQLMTTCKHFIIANSTYSWWAAYLGVRDDGVVICPEPWFVDTTVDSTDLIPSSWTRLDRLCD
jgi:hypothetical protein